MRIRYKGRGHTHKIFNFSQDEVDREGVADSVECRDWGYGSYWVVVHYLNAH